MSRSDKARSGWERLCEEIAAGDQRRLNWRAMNYFVKRRRWEEAAQCRERVGQWNARGPV